MWPRDTDTVRLIEAIGAGRREAADPLLARHRPVLRRWVSLRLDPALRGRVDASDVVQDTLTEASRRLDEFASRRPMPFHLWLRRIALDRLIAEHRRHRVAGKRSVEREGPARVHRADRSSLDLLAEAADTAPGPATAAVRAELECRLRGALDRLEADDREIILLRHFERLSNGEAAQALGLRPAAAGMRHLRALRRLRAALGGELDEPREGT